MTLSKTPFNEGVFDFCLTKALLLLIKLYH